MKHVRGGILAMTATVSLMGALASGASAAKTVTLPDSQSPAAARTPRVGSVARATAMHFEVDLKLADQSGAEALARAVSTPGSASYGAYLTPAQWEARFSPTAADVSQVTAFLHASGFLVGAVSADRTAIEASGTAQQVEQAFGTALSYHRVHGDTLLLADRQLSIPASIAGVVGAVTGVSDTVARPDNTTGAPHSTPGAQQPAGFRVAPPCGTYYGQAIDTTLPQFPGYPANPPWAVCGYTGPQFRSAYGLTSNGDDGSGQTVAIVDAYASPTLFSDAHHFAALNDPGNPLRAGQFSELLAGSYTKGGPNQCGASGWYGEQTLDVEAVHDTAPGANILFAGARNCFTPALNQMVRKIVDGHLASVITNSYGDNAGDVLDSAGDRQSTDNILLMAAATGVTTLFSSGDNGDEYTAVGQVAADYPSSSPWTTAVGGTTTQIGAGGQMTGQYGWSTARSFLCNAAFEAAGGCTSDQLGTWLPIDETLDGGSGGGTSVVYAQPFYQRGVVPASLSEANGSTPMRVEPDVSMEADPATGMLVGETQQFPDGTYYDQYRIGGTSVASPLLAGVVARINEGRRTPIGFLNPRLYSLYGNAGALTDIVSPASGLDQSRADYANSIDPSAGYFYTTRIIDYQGQEEFCDVNNVCTTRPVALATTPGYDNMTGLGAPGAGFVAALSRR
ncbi:MAG: S53 family peptidase [Solirubrobacteraceae bacterium]